MRWRTLGGERRAATNAIERANRAIARQDWTLALRYYARATEHAVRVAAAGDVQDSIVLGSVYYNLADLHAKAGQIAMAWLCALQACYVYAKLDPTDGDPSQVGAVLHARTVPIDLATGIDARGDVSDSAAVVQLTPRVAEERIAHAADAKSRYVQLSAGLVMAHGAKALRVDIGGGALDGITDPAAVVERIGERSVLVYEQLARHGELFTEADVKRTSRRVEDARRLLGSRKLPGLDRP